MQTNANGVLLVNISSQASKSARCLHLQIGTAQQITPSVRAARVQMPLPALHIDIAPVTRRKRAQNLHTVSHWISIAEPGRQVHCVRTTYDNWVLWVKVTHITEGAMPAKSSQGLF